MDDDPRSAYVFLAAVGRGRGPKSDEKGGSKVGGVAMAVAVDAMVFRAVCD